MINKIRQYLFKTDLYQVLNLDKEFNIDFLAQGEYNINYTISDKSKRFVFRINTTSQLRLENQINYEYKALKAIEESGVTPKGLFVDGSKKYFNFGILVMEFLEGRPLSYSTDLEIASHIFSKIHSIDINNLKENNFIIENSFFKDRISESTWLLEKFFASPIPSKELKSFFSNYLEWCDKNLYKERFFAENSWKVINNTEVNSHNFIIGKKGYLIDWEKPVISHPCQDLTQFLADTTTLWRNNYIMCKEEKEFFLKSYANKVNHSLDEIKTSIEMYNPYLYLRALSWCAMAFIEYQTEDKLLRNDEIFNKIKSYLDFDFLSKLLKPYDIKI